MTTSVPFVMVLYPFRGIGISVTIQDPGIFTKGKTGKSCSQGFKGSVLTMKTKRMSGRSMKKTRVLFLCTQNAGRSQMAEGYLRARYGDRYEAFSAGTHPTNVSRKAVAVMQEIGVDISGQRSKSLSDLAGEQMDLAVALCSNASGLCPIYPFADRTIHQNFPDPGALSGSEEEVMEGIREIRDQIVSWIDTFFSEGKLDRSALLKLS